MRKVYGTFKISDLKDNDKMAEVFKTMPEKAPIRSIVLGILSMCLQLFGYLTLGIWMKEYSPVWANLRCIGILLKGTGKDLLEYAL